MAIQVLVGAALASAIAKARKAVAEYFPKAGEAAKVHGRGRAIESPIGRYADEYLREIPLVVRTKELNEKPAAIFAFIDLLIENRRDLSEAEADYVANGRDAQVMGTLEGEPVQPEVYLPFPVIREEGQTLGQAFADTFAEVAVMAQALANKSGKTLYAVAERYCVERNLRNADLAVKYGAPLSAVGVMSKNLGCVTLTDNEGKQFKGAVARLATFTPEPRKRNRPAAQVAQPERVLVNA